MYRTKFDEYVVSFAYGQYTTGSGGTDKAILNQQELLNNSGISFVYFYPITRINRMIKFCGDQTWGIIIDGMDCGLIETKGIIGALDRFQSQGKRLYCVIIHHLNRISIMELDSLLDAIKGRVFLYLHDYRTICPWGGLIDSNDHYCRSSFPSAGKCGDCKKYHENKGLECKRMIYKYADRIVFIAPSEAAKVEWVKTYNDLAEKVYVIEHKIPTGQYYGNNDIIKPNEKIKVAFVGYQSNLKGWKYWKKAIISAQNSGANEEFYQFGTVQDHMVFVKEVHVDFKESETAMTDALRKEGIHCAVLWSIWPETFSYTYYEAWASNCFILTNRISGNIAAQVEKNGNGYVADDPEELEFLLCETDRLREMINNYRAKRMVNPDKLIDNEEIRELILAEECDIIADKKDYKSRKIKHLIKNILYFTEKRRKQYKVRR